MGSLLRESCNRTADGSKKSVTALETEGCARITRFTFRVSGKKSRGSWLTPKNLRIVLEGSTRVIQIHKVFVVDAAHPKHSWWFSASALMPLHHSNVFIINYLTLGHRIAFTQAN